LTGQAESLVSYIKSKTASMATFHV